MKKVLTIAGSDSCGGAGIQADLKTFGAHGVYGMSVITAVTAQNTQGVFAVQDIQPEIIAGQIDAIFTDIEVDAVKIGMVSVVESIKIISEKLLEYQAKNIVLDPVMVSKSGFPLLQEQAKAALVKYLLPLALLVTPNIPEAEALTGKPIRNLSGMEEAARMIAAAGPAYVLIKGGHRQEDATDLLFDGVKSYALKSKKIKTKNTHGTGCTLSSAIASNLAKGYSMVQAVEKGKEYINTAIEHSLAIGQGVGPTNHFYDLYQRAGLKE